MKRDEKRSVKLWGGCLCAPVTNSLLSLHIHFKAERNWRVGLGLETQLWSFPCCATHWEANTRDKSFTCVKPLSLVLAQDIIWILLCFISRRGWQLCNDSEVMGLARVHNDHSLTFLWLLPHRLCPSAIITTNHHLCITSFFPSPSRHKNCSLVLFFNANKAIYRWNTWLLCHSVEQK